MRSNAPSTAPIPRSTDASSVTSKPSRDRDSPSTVQPRASSSPKTAPPIPPLVPITNARFIALSVDPARPRATSFDDEPGDPEVRRCARGGEDVHRFDRGAKIAAFDYTPTLPEGAEPLPPGVDCMMF